MQEAHRPGAYGTGKMLGWLVERGIDPHIPVAVARKLAVILHRMWRDGSDFMWSSTEAAA